MNLEEVLRRLQHHGIWLRMKKCSFLQKSVEYLGHCIDATSLHTTSKKVEAVQLAPTPCDQTQLRSFLGLLHYYGKFMPNFGIFSPSPEHSAPVWCGVEVVC